MKDFHSWVSERANSYTDNSVVNRTKVAHSEMYVRMLFANLMVPNPNTSSLVHTWIYIFTSKKVFDFLERDYILSIIGKKKGAEFYSTKEHDLVEWLVQFKKDIENGWAPCYS